MKGKTGRILWLAAKVAFVTATLAFVGHALIANWPQVRAAWRAPAPGLAAAATVVLLLSYIYLYKISLAVLARVGYRLSFRAGLRPFFYTLLGRYIPGRVAVFLGKVYMYGRRSVPGVAAALAPAYENVLAAVGGLAVTVVAAAALFGSQFSWQQLLAAGLGIAALAASIQPAVLRRLLGAVLRRMKRGPLEPTAVMGPSPAAAFAAAYGGYCLLLGVFFALFAGAFVPLGPGEAARAGAAYVVAAVLGYVVVFTPSGLGVREGLLLILLKQYMPPGDAAFLAIASRLVSVGAELLLAAVAAAVGNSAPAEKKE